MALSVDQKRLKATKFPPEFDLRVDSEKVNMDLMKKWIAGKLMKILGDEDDVVIETTYNLLEQHRYPRIKEIQIQLDGFLEKACAPFCKELWSLMLSAQSDKHGVPKELLEAKKLELKQEQASKAAAENRRRQEKEQEDMVNAFRESERSDRRDRNERSERGHGRGGFRGDRSFRGRDSDRGPPRRRSRSPPRRRRSSPPRRDRDLYIPSRARERYRSLSSDDSPARSRSRSRSPRRQRRRRSPSESRSPRRGTRDSLSPPSPPRRSRRDQSSSRSRSPAPRRRRYSSSRSRSPHERRGRKRGGKERYRSPSRERRSRRHHTRSITPSDRSSSPSTRRSDSYSPPPRRRRYERSRSRSQTRANVAQVLAFLGPQADRDVQSDKPHAHPLHLHTAKKVPIPSKWLMRASIKPRLWNNDYTVYSQQILSIRITSNRVLFFDEQAPEKYGYDGTDTFVEQALNTLPCFTSVSVACLRVCEKLDGVSAWAFCFLSAFFLSLAIAFLCEQARAHVEPKMEAGSTFPSFALCSDNTDIIEFASFN